MKRIERGTVHTYRYSFGSKVRRFFGFIFLWIRIVILVVGLLLAIYHSIIPFVAAASLFLLLHIYSLRRILVHGQLSLDNTGIAVRLFGLETRRIYWEDIAKIKRFSVNKETGYGKYYLVCPKKRSRIGSYFWNVFGDIVFSPTILDIDDLLAGINSHAQRRKVPLILVGRKRSSEDTENNSKEGYWSGLFPSRPEIQVDEL